MSRAILGRMDPCICGSGKKYRKCCYPRTLPDFSKPNAGVPTPFEENEALGRALERLEALSRHALATSIDTVDVGRTRVTCAPLPPYGDNQVLPGTDAPPTPFQIESKYREIQKSNSEGATEVVVTYTYPEAFGCAEARMVFDADELFPLVDGRVIRVLEVFRGMHLVMADGSIGTVIGNPERRFEIPVPPLPCEDGLWSSRVMGLVKHTAHEIVDFRWAGQTVHVTAGHAVWSADRRGWVGAHQLREGEMIRVSGNRIAPVEEQRRLPGMIEVFGIEVEYFHNYFVGRGPNAMLVHNGPDCVLKPKEAGLFDELPDPEGPLGGGVRSLRENQYDPTQIEPGRVIRGTEEIRGVVGDALRAEGTHSDTMSGLHAFVRQGKGAGFQAVTRNPLDRPSIVIRNFGKSTGEVMASIDLTKIDPAQVFDFRSPEVQEAFLSRYPRFSKQIDRLASEGVVAVRGDIPVEAVTGVLRVTKPADAATVHAALSSLSGGE